MDTPTLIISAAAFVAGYYFKTHQEIKLITDDELIEDKKKKSKIKKTWDNLKKKSNDVWTTPINVVKEQIRYVEDILDDARGQIWVDPFRHTGAYYNNYPRGVKKEWAEITEGKCALEVDYKNKIVVSNPPYSMLEKLITKMTGDGLGDGAAVISLLILSIHLTAPRLKKIEDAGYTIADIQFINIKGWWPAARVTWVKSCYKPLQTIGVDYIRGGNRV